MRCAPARGGKNRKELGLFQSSANPVIKAIVDVCDVVGVGAVVVVVVVVGVGVVVVGVVLQNRAQR